MASAKGSSYDYGLRLYRDLLGLDHLHFGLWADEDPRDLEGFRAAQERYMRRLLDKFPDDAKRVLDVGCGTGALSLAALERGYAIEALSPCEHQERELRGKVGDRLPYHRARFQDFRPAGEYDLVVCSESAQYVPLADLFTRARACLGGEGHFLVCDYFRLEHDRYYRACHVLPDFMAAARDAGFELVEEEDITEAVTPTLEVGRAMYERFVLPLAEVAQDYAERERPKLTWLARRVLRKQLEKVRRYVYEKTPDKLDVDRFRAKVRYRTMLFALRVPASVGERAADQDLARAEAG
jgi:cyclopropane fatty-acyl-phospholipid synthase-like methyltransferase